MATHPAVSVLLRVLSRYSHSPVLSLLFSSRQNHSFFGTAIGHEQVDPHTRGKPSQADAGGGFRGVRGSTGRGDCWRGFRRGGDSSSYRTNVAGFAGGHPGGLGKTPG